VPAAGGVLVLVNFRLSSAEVGYILRHSDARYLLLAAELEPLVAPLDLAGVTVIGCADGGGGSYEQFLAQVSPERPASWLADEDETNSIDYTSGTAGRRHPEMGLEHGRRVEQQRRHPVAFAQPG